MHHCTNCGDDIETADVRYERRAPDTDAIERFCSVGCLTGVDDLDEAVARDRLFSATQEL
ncbi:hypothetical protein [Haloarchaeobius sp. DYHT-AS-18]|uniref:hypothetical protein n=1 Tax=Haloarchaeobius sp. DYHT-AS-18 TaxID=3446117 RepID=UPI003EC1117E